MSWEEGAKEKDDQSDKKNEPSSRVIVMKEMAEGNASVGTQWIETHSFPIGAPLGDIIDWASDAKGRIMIERDQAYDDNNNDDNKDPEK